MDSNKIFDNLSKIVEAQAKQEEKKRQDGIAEKTVATTTNNNKEFTDFIKAYNSNRNKNEEKVRNRLKTDSSYTGDRSTAVKEAWKIEQADISMGGKGITRKWTKEESAIILSGKTVSGYEGHHEKNVADHPEEQANPNNIGFYSRKEHLKEHNGNFKNPTDGKLINKEKKLQKTNTKRNVKNELTGAANATVPNVVKGFINGCIDSTEKNSTIKDAIKSGCKSALKSGGKALVDYGFTRLLKQ